MAELKNPSDETIHNACGGCDLLPTKPGSEPPHLAYTVSQAMELEELIELGVTVTLDDVTPRQLAILKGVKRGRNRAERERNKAEQDNSNPNRHSNLAKNPDIAGSFE